MPEYDFGGKVAFVTGAAHGQGESHAVTYAEHGASVVAVDVPGDIDTVAYPQGTREELDETVEAVEAQGQDAIAVEADVRDEDQVEAAVDAALDAFGHIDFLANNAGILSSDLLVELDERKWDQMLDTNLKGVWLCSKHVGKHFIERGEGGKIVTTSSTGGTRGSLGRAGHYGAAKWGVRGLTKTLALELADYGVNVILEKGTSLTKDGYDRMIAAMEEGGGKFLTNWPLAWYQSHRTTKRLIDEGAVGEVLEVHYYDGNEGSGRFEKVEYTDAGEMHFSGGSQKEVASAAETWWHQADKGGGSLVDYLGYGTNLATWFRDGELPVEVTTRTNNPEWSQVDIQSITVAKYEGKGLSTFETRWGTFTDPWVHQPQPKCGFVVKGSEGTISSYDYEETVFVQDEENPEGYEVAVDDLEEPIQNQVQYLVHCLDTDQDVEFPPLSPYHCRESNRILVAALESAERDEPVQLE